MLSVCGIDPGLEGAIAILGDDGSVACHNMPTFEIAKAGSKGKRRCVDDLAVVRILENRVRLRHAFIERVHAMPGQGGVSMFNFGEGYGIVKCAAAALRIPRTFYDPLVWKKFYRLPKGDKEASRLRATELFPEHAAQWEMVRGEVSRDQAGGRAEAALLALYGRQHLDNEFTNRSVAP